MNPNAAHVSFAVKVTYGTELLSVDGVNPYITIRLKCGSSQKYFQTKIGAVDIYWQNPQYRKTRSK